MVMQNFLAEKYTGMMISCSGLLGRISNGCKVRPDQRYILGELYKHLKEMAERFYSGDIKAVDGSYKLGVKRHGKTEILARGIWI